MEKIELEVAGISYSQTQTGAYALVLQEIDGDIKLPIVIGATEAQAIAIEKEGLMPVRPLTHDLFVKMASSFAISIIEVNIIDFKDGIFFSELVCERGSAIVKIDARPSDAIALALRFRSRIFIKPDILDKTGIRLPSDKNGNSEQPVEAQDDTAVKDKTVEQLNKMMEIAIEEEDYEFAAIIKKELDKR